jgi:hypothetical protein
MTDILTKLQKLVEKNIISDDGFIIKEAMDEIERLRKQINLHNFRAHYYKETPKPPEKEKPFRWSEYTGK